MERAAKRPLGASANDASVDRLIVDDLRAAGDASDLARGEAVGTIVDDLRATSHVGNFLCGQIANQICVNFLRCGDLLVVH